MGYGRVLTIEPNNRRAQDSLRQLDYLRSMDEKLELARGDLRRGDIYGADRQVKQILELDPTNDGALELQGSIRLVQSRNVVQYPQLRTRLDRPVTLEFRDANLKTIFEVLSQVAGLNFIFDKDLRPDMKATIFVRDVRIEDAVALLLQQNQLHQKVVNENTLLIYPDSPQKLKDYQELVMRTFYLTSIDANTALNMIKTMLKTRDVFVDERLNTLTMRDSEDAVRMAEKLLQSQDQSNPEVVLEVEVMEVARQRILDLGLQWPNTFGVLNSAGGDVTVLDQLKGITSSRISISPSPQAKINAQDNDINTLASPVIRVSNREQARIHIGQRVPIISATAVPSTQGPVITESVTYLDVGLKLEVQPTVHLNNEVAIKIALEVSNATPLQPTRQGTIPVQVDTRNAQTTLRLHDGETQILAGLVRNDHGASGNKIPGLGDIPWLGRLFGSNKDTVGQSELVLSITPRIVRNLPYQSPSDMEFPTGTETSMHIQAPERGMEPATRTEIINSPMAASTQVFVEKP
jgi:general secretion pathway protein D